MKYNINLFFLVLLLASSSCTIPQENLAQTKEAMNAQTNAIIQEQDNLILSKDFTIAEKVLNQGIERKDKKTLRLGLKNRLLLLNQKTGSAIVKEIVEMKDKSFVTDLAEALEQNQGIVAGGGEIYFLQRDLDKTLITALNELTELNFKVLNSSSLGDVNELAKYRENVNQIIGKSLEWSKIHETEIQQVIKSEKTANQEENSILNENYIVVKKALDKAILEKDKKTIRLGLKSPYFPVKQKLVEAIAEIGDETFVPDLIKSFRANQGMFTGGTETKAMQNDLNRAIISALERLTKLKFKVSKFLSAEDIKEVLDRSRDWYKSRKKDM